MTKSLTWREAAALNVGDRVVFNEPWELFALGLIIEPGQRGIIVEQGLNEISPILLVRPDNLELRKRFAEWDGLIQLTPEGGGYPFTFKQGDDEFALSSHIDKERYSIPFTHIPPHKNPASIDIWEIGYTGGTGPWIELRDGVYSIISVLNDDTTYATLGEAKVAADRTFGRGPVTAKTEFPNYPHDALPAIPEGWEDVSWHNDVCPSYARKDEAFVVFLNYPDPADREIEGERFFLCANDEFGTAGEAILVSDDWAAIVAKIEELKV